MLYPYCPRQRVPTVHHPLLGEALHKSSIVNLRECGSFCPELYDCGTVSSNALASAVCERQDAAADDNRFDHWEVASLLQCLYKLTKNAPMDFKFRVQFSASLTLKVCANSLTAE